MKTNYLVQEPQQMRSQQNMDQIMDATAQILESKNFDELTISEVVAQAGTSVGAFYGRFKDKDALLQALDERFFQGFESEFKLFQEAAHWEEKSIASIVREAINFIVEIYSKEKGVLRSLNLKARQFGDSQFQEREKRAWDELFPQLQNRLLAQQSEISHPNPGLATRLGFQLIFFSMREFVLWEPLREDTPYDTELLITELSRAYLNYLGIKEA